MRWSNFVIQQADLVLAIGTRFSFWETGFNWAEFAPLASIWSFNIDESELEKPGPDLDQKILCDLNVDFSEIIHQIEENVSRQWIQWVEFVKMVKETLPLSEISNNQFPDYCNPFEIISEIANALEREDILIPCSSGGAYTTVMQGFRQKRGQLLTNNRGLASMGYGLAGAIGTCFANPASKIVSIEGDGGFLQNLSEIATVALHNLNLKMFIIVNNGYASIKLSQKANFNGHYVGCDPETGVAIPDLKKVILAFGIPVYDITANSIVDDLEFILGEKGPIVGLIHVHPDQAYYPKIASKLSAKGEIESNPIHLMQPEISPELFESVMKFTHKSSNLQSNG
jgi:acetolactate synthase-1/2/3 large subunit